MNGRGVSRGAWPKLLGLGLLLAGLFMMHGVTAASSPLHVSEPVLSLQAAHAAPQPQDRAHPPAGTTGSAAFPAKTHNGPPTAPSAPAILQSGPANAHGGATQAHGGATQAHGGATQAHGGPAGEHGGAAGEHGGGMDMGGCIAGAICFTLLGLAVLGLAALAGRALDPLPALAGAASPALRRRGPPRTRPPSIYRLSVLRL